LPTGQAVMTKGYKLPAKYVIHTVGPVWHGGANNEDELLADCFRNSLELAQKHGIKSISFPAISTGAYRFPINRAAKISVRTVYDYLKERSFGEAVFVLFSEKDFEAFKKALQSIAK